jgi:ATP-binding cassette subfamily B protein
VAPRFVIEAAGMILLAALALIIADREGGLAGALPILGALALGAQRLLPLIQQVYYGWSAYAGNRAVAGDVLNLLGMPVPEHATVVAKRAAPLSFKREIRIEGVSFAYSGRSEPALSAVSLTIPRGARVALIGQTGSGKSTLADLLMGLLEPGSGQILVDGVPLVGEARRAWRQSIAHVPQAIFLADTSVERNIAFGVAPEQIDRDRVVDAARRAELHSFLAGLPDGYQTPVGERGVRFSGGQRQRLGIARAIYKAAPVLVLDEATSALDSATEEAVTQALADLGDRGMTIIMIAHRLSTIENCDIVVRLENGRVVATGSYQEVVRGNVGDLPGHG